VAEGDSRVASEAVAALRAYRNDERVRKALEEALEKRGTAG
jgi:hypothetical protein